MKRRFIFAAAILASVLGASSGAQAQSACPYIAYGAVLTAALWNQCFANKQDTLGYVPVNKSGDVMLGKLTMMASTPTSAGINLPQGSAPTNPNNGDLWTTLAGVFARINGATVGPFAGASSATFAGTAPITVSFPAGIVTFALNIDSNFAVVANNLAFASIASGNLIANSTAGSAEPTSTTLTALIDRAMGSTRGSILERGASAWAPITPGTTAFPFVSNGAAADPAYQLLTGSGIAANTVANSNIVQSAAVTLKGNPTNALANVSDFTIGGLTALASPDAANDYLLIWDHTAGTFKKINPSSIATAGGITSLTTDVVATGPGAAAATIQPNVVTYAKFQQVAGLSLVGNATGSLANATGIGTGTGVITALGVNVGTAGSVVVNGGALGTPLSGVATNFTGTAAGLTAGNVTTNANLTGPVTSVGNATSVTTAAITNTMLATTATNTVKGNATSGSASPTDLAIGSCSTAASALIWTTNTGFSCNTSITAAAVPASGLTGTTLAGGVVTSSLTTVGALGAGSATTGFSIAGASVTWSSQIAGANVATVANASGSPSATFGVMKADGTTIQCTSGTCSAVGGVATSVTVGTTTVNSSSGSNQLLTTGTVVAGTGTLANIASTSVVFGTGTLNLSGNLATTGAFNPTFAIPASVTYTFPGSAANLAALNIADQTVTGGANVTSLSQSTGSITVDCGARPIQYITNNGAYTITAPSSDGSCFLFVTNGASAGATTFTGFTVGSNTGAALTTTNTNKFTISIWRANGTSGYSIFAHQ